MDKYKIYKSAKDASKILGVHFMTLRSWAEKGQIEIIRTPSGKRMYNVDKYIKESIENKRPDEMIEKSMEEQKIRRKICYCRVSTLNQSDDLKRQVEYMKKHYPKHEIIKEYGSGLNFKRKKLIKLIKDSINGEIEEIVVAYKDRLARFGFELIEMIVKDYSDGVIIILNNDEKMSPTEEITKDLVSIINVFSAKINGLRKYSDKIKKIKE